MKLPTFCGESKSPHIVGSQKAHNCDDRQQSVNPLLPVKMNPTQTMEPLRPSTTVRLRARPGTRGREPACRLLARLDITPEDRIHLKLNDQIPVHHIEIDVAAKPPKQGDDEEVYDPEQQKQQTETTDPSEQQNMMQSTPTTTSLNCSPCCISLADNQQQPDDDPVKMIQIISRHLERVLAGEAPPIMLTNFTRRHRSHTVNLVCPQGA